MRLSSYAIFETGYRLIAFSILEYVMDSKLLIKAKDDFALVCSGLFDILHNLKDALIICISHNVYVLYNCEPQSYYFIELIENSYDILYQ
jgi:hypothetical protein